MYFLILQEGSQKNIGNSQKECYACLQTLSKAPSRNTISKTCTVMKKPVRIGCKKIDKFFISLCVSKDPQSSRLFNDRLQALKEVYVCLQSSIAEQKKDIEQRFKELSHNIVTYNAKCLHALYLLIPQEKFVSSSDKTSFVKSCISKDVNTATDSLLTTLKGLELIKHEISVYNKLHGAEVRSELKIEKHKIHKLMQMALNVFWRDFHDKKVKINHANCNYYVKVDFESFMAAIIHLVGNMSKYTLSDNEVSIDYEKDNNTLILTIAMMSLYIHPNEVDKIWDIGYSGELAREIQKDGNGLGMYAIKELITLNHGEFIFYPNTAVEKSVSVNGIRYSNNKAIIKIPISG